MAINLVVAITDYDWFTTLRGTPDLSEVNFWSPGGVNFRALKPGELFLFKLKAKHGDKIVGGGIFAHHTFLPLSVMWDRFGIANGANSPGELRKRLSGLRSVAPSSQEDFAVGCRILTQPFFFDQSDWIDRPQSFTKNLQTFKKYNTADVEGRDLWEQVQGRLSRQSAHESGVLVAEASARYGEPQLITPRLGQGAFRTIVTDVYERRCAVTRERTLPALDAAHIRRYSEGGEHATTNGLLLRKDIHSLFDLGYVTVTPSHHFAVSPRIREEFENGHEYYDYNDSKILVPRQPEHRPDPDALMWHNENVFKK